MVVLLPLGSAYDTKGLIFFSNKNPEIQSNGSNQFPFVGQKMEYDVTSTAASLLQSSGKLEVEYHRMSDETTIIGSFHVEINAIIEYYNETAWGTEDINNRNLTINQEGTYLINLFMYYFFDWSSNVTPTPMWIFPENIAVNESVQFWNYTSTCLQSKSIPLMGKFYEVFVFRSKGTFLDMTLMYGFARHGDGEWYGLLFYYKASFVEPSQDLYMEAVFILADTNAELLPLRKLNRNIIIITAISFYTVTVIGFIVFRMRKRRDLIGGET
ncbi:MAG: hypothetical protein ACTSSB_11130 [Candidatus Heimdallarchaeota archaeon]